MEAPSHVMLQYGGEDWGPLLVRCWWLVLEAGEHKGWRVTRTTNTLGFVRVAGCAHLYIIPACADVGRLLL